MYYALITHLDYENGKFINAMQEYRVLDDTVILFTSNKGKLLGDRHKFAKSLRYEGSAGVPLFIYDYGNHLQLDKGRQVDQVVELRDIMPTLLDVANVSIASSVDGKILLPLARGENCKIRDYLHGEHSYREDFYHYITNGTEKYIWYSQMGIEQYFRLTDDHYKMKNERNNPLYAIEWMDSGNCS